ncbi:hypothetical protein K440DRAFT_632296, partial [Wilcoxina mikolae CBS 423.85]
MSSRTNIYLPPLETRALLEWRLSVQAYLSYIVLIICLKCKITPAKRNSNAAGYMYTAH